MSPTDYSNINNPHDKLFKLVFEDPAETASFLGSYLPADLVERIDWPLLEL